MLRRPPTLITLTSDDINAYEESRQARRAQARAAANSAAGQASGLDPSEQDMGQSSRKQVAFDPSDELKPLPGDKARVVRYSGSIGGSQAAGSSTDAARTRAREERIGIGR